ncbi:hypothetical protein Tco_1286896 [Tanacetum coccineum]
MDDDLFTYEVKITNIPYDSKMDDDSEHEVDDDMGYDLSDVAFTEWLGSKPIKKDDWIYEWNKDVLWVDEKPWTNAGV